MGFDQSYSLLNFGFASFVIPLASVFLFIMKLVSYLPIPSVKKTIEQKILKKAIWNFYFVFFNEMYLNMSLCALIQFTDFKFNDLGSLVNCVFCLIITGIIFCFPLLTTVFYYKKFNHFKDKKRAYVNRYGQLLKDYRLYYGGRKVLVYFASIFIRKFTLMACLVMQRNQPL